MTTDPNDEWIRNRYAYASDTFDRTVLWLSGGAAALSITFAADIADGSIDGRGWALGAWISLALAVVLITASHLPAALAARAAAERRRDQDRWQELTAKMKRRSLTALGLSIAAGVALATGLFLLALFSYHNLPAI